MTTQRQAPESMGRINEELSSKLNQHLPTQLGAPLFALQKLKTDKLFPEASQE
jgi:hypothetical protein